MKEYRNYCTKNRKRCFSNGSFCGRRYLYTKIEYNTDTSAEHPIKDDDIVRTTWKHVEFRDKLL